MLCWERKKSKQTATAYQPANAGRQIEFEITGGKNLVRILLKTYNHLWSLPMTPQQNYSAYNFCCNKAQFMYETAYFQQAGLNNKCAITF